MHDRAYIDAGVAAIDADVLAPPVAVALGEPAALIDATQASRSARVALFSGFPHDAPATARSRRYASTVCCERCAARSSR